MHHFIYISQEDPIQIRLTNGPQGLDFNVGTNSVPASKSSDRNNLVSSRLTQPYSEHDDAKFWKFNVEESTHPPVPSSQNANASPQRSPLSKTISANPDFNEGLRSSNITNALTMASYRTLISAWLAVDDEMRFAEDSLAFKCADLYTYWIRGLDHTNELRSWSNLLPKIWTAVSNIGGLYTRFDRDWKSDGQVKWHIFDPNENGCIMETFRGVEKRLESLDEGDDEQKAIVRALVDRRPSQAEIERFIEELFQPFNVEMTRIHAIDKIGLKALDYWNCTGGREQKEHST